MAHVGRRGWHAADQHLSDQLRLLKHLAAEEDKPVADFARQAVDQFLRNRLENDVTWQSDMTALIERVCSRVSPASIPKKLSATSAKRGTT